MVSFARDEFFAHGKHLLSAGRRVIEHRVHGEKRDNGQNLLSAGEVWRDQDGLQNIVKKNVSHMANYKDKELFRFPHHVLRL